jgi:MFS family permease
MLVASGYASDRNSILLLLAASASLGLQSPHVYAVSQSLAGPRVAGIWTSLQQFVGSFGAVLAPFVTGLVVQKTGNFVWAFLIAGAAGMAGVFCWLFLVGPVRPIVWDPMKVAPISQET